MKNFGELVEGKRIVVVAPSGYLRSRRLGAFIDSFDLVVKLNNIFDMEQTTEDLGARCDLWYGIPSPRYFKLGKLIENNNPQILCIQNKNKNNEAYWARKFAWFLTQNKEHQINFRITDERENRAFEERLGCVPMMGLTAIHDLLQFNVKEVYALGFDFHRSGYFSGQPVDNSAHTVGWHRTESMERFFWELTTEDSRFDCDDYLKDILNSKFDTKYDSKTAQEKLLSQEMTHFCSKKSARKVLLFRSCTLSSFQIIATELFKRIEPENITIPIQPSLVKNTLLKGCNLIDYGHEGPLSYQQVKSSCPTLFLGKYDLCLIPYNGLKLKSYLEILLIVQALNIAEVFFVSLQGIMNKIENIDFVIDEIIFYLEVEEKIEYLQFKYGRAQFF